MNDCLEDRSEHPKDLKGSDSAYMYLIEESTTRLAREMVFSASKLITNVPWRD